MLPAALGIILDGDKKSVLLVKRRDVAVWVLPGGGIDPGETPEEAVVREVWEETGLRIAIERKTGEYHPINRLASETHVFECIKRDGALRSGCETRELAYWPLAALPKSLFIVHRDWLEDALTASSVVQKPITRVTYRAFAAYVIRHPCTFLRFLWTRITT